MKKKPHADWHPADIKAALAKAGWSFRRIAREYGYGEKSPDAVLRRRFGPMEQIVARLLGTEASAIWPSRYGVERRGGGERRKRAQRRADRRSGLERRKRSAHRTTAA